MTDFLSLPSTAFDGATCLAAGPLADVALAVKMATESHPDRMVLTFADETGAVIDLDLRGDKADILRRLRERGEVTVGSPQQGDAKPARGRPKLGVVAREVTLLPRHWDWLAAQPGGASQALRRLVDQARGAEGGKASKTAARDAAYRFMSAMAGNFAGFEEASRALFAGDRPRLEAFIAQWPVDVRDYVLRLLGS